MLYNTLSWLNSPFRDSWGAAAESAGTAGEIGAIIGAVTRAPVVAGTAGSGPHKASTTLNLKASFVSQVFFFIYTTSDALKQTMK
jgi:hypothetical protein